VSFVTRNIAAPDVFLPAPASPCRSLLESMVPALTRWRRPRRAQAPPGVLLHAPRRGDGDWTPPRTGRFSSRRLLAPLEHTRTRSWSSSNLAIAMAARKDRRQRRRSHTLPALFLNGIHRSARTARHTLA